MSLEIDEAAEGMEMIALITAVSPRPDKVGSPTIELSLMNSLIHGKKQRPIGEEEQCEGNVFYRLGLLRIEPKFRMGNMAPLDRYIAMDPQVRNYNALDTLISELGISEFATLKYKDDRMIYQSNLNFDYAKLRDVQNIDWAEENIKLGEKMASKGGPPEDVLKYYESAIGLDPLNKAGYVMRADLFRNVVHMYLFWVGAS